MGCGLLIYLTEHPFPAVRFVCGRRSISETAAAYEFAQYRSMRNLHRRYVQKVIEELQQSFGLSIFGHLFLFRRHRSFCSKRTATVSCLGLPDTPKAGETARFPKRLSNRHPLPKNRSNGSISEICTNAQGRTVSKLKRQAAWAESPRPRETISPPFSIRV